MTRWRVHREPITLLWISAPADWPNGALNYTTHHSWRDAYDNARKEATRARTRTA